MPRCAAMAITGTGRCPRCKLGDYLKEVGCCSAGGGKGPSASAAAGPPAAV